MTKLPLMNPATTRRAFALPIVIWLLVLVTVSVVTLLFLVRNDRTASLHYGEDLKAQEIAKAGLETFVLDLRHEMRAGSTVTTTAGTEIFQPKTAASMRVQPIANAPLAPNHLRSSAQFTPATVFSTDDYTQSELPPVRASDSPTTASSANGLRVPKEIWDAVQLAAAGALDNTTPNWILVQRKGVASAPVTWSDELRNKLPSNQDYVIGRYAFQVYVVDGLLDINVAGHPSTLSAAEKVALEGTQGAVDLADLGEGFTSANVDALIDFRNAATKVNFVDAYTDPLVANRGSLTTVAGDNRFLSRKDLIRYAKKNGFSDALEYLTHFSREVNAPSWFPTDNVSASYAYLTNANSASSANRFVPGNVTTSGETVNNYAVNGAASPVTVEAGMPKIWRRFPLARLDWLRQVEAGIGGAPLQTAVLAGFGLRWDTGKGRWIYDPTNSGTMATGIRLLSEVPAGQEPNFFELLKAAVLSGSLGSAGTRNEMLQSYSYDWGYRSTGQKLQDPNLDYQIMKIGAAMIDQYDADSSPTLIDFDYAPTLTAAWKAAYLIPASGVENLPYMYGFTHYALLSRPSSGTLKTDVWLRLRLWNLHQQKSSAPGTSNLRVATGAGIDPAALMRGSYSVYSSGDTFLHMTSGMAATGSDFINLANANFLTPKDLLSTDSSDLGGQAADFSYSGTTKRGFYLGSSTFATSDAPVQYTQYLPYLSNYAATTSKNPIPVQMEYRDSSNRWRPYSVIPFSVTAGLRQNVYPTIVSASVTATGVGNECGTFDLFDPRTTRFGFALHARSPATNSSAPYLSTFTKAPASDPDGITRPDDTGTVKPYSAGGTAERPILLDRAFRTPADLGYVFRDQPWKTLDFRSKESADAGILDMFSILDDPKVVAGRVNLNNARPEVIKAIVQGSVKNEAAGMTFSATEAQTIADNFKTWIDDQKAIRNRADLVKFPAVSGFTSDRKFEKEGTIRALSGVGQTRTINLLLDIVAQAGSYPVTASGLSNFRVTAQCHYWAHIAIDRFTGQVVDIQWEPVYEN